MISPGERYGCLLSALKFHFARKLPRAGKQVKAAADELSSALGWGTRTAAEQ